MTRRFPARETTPSTPCASGPPSRRAISTSTISTTAITTGPWRTRPTRRSSPRCSTPTTTRPGQGAPAQAGILLRVRHAAGHHPPVPESTMTPSIMFPDKVAIQLNDTHPAIAIPELMRMLIDGEGLDWDKAWEITVKTFGYTNHTILPEALENVAGGPDRAAPAAPHADHLRDQPPPARSGQYAPIPATMPGCSACPSSRKGRRSRVRMANLAIAGSHSVNGVAALHTEILKTGVFRDFFELWPEKFNNKTNGITQRRWLRLCNPGLSSLISSRIGDGWATDLYELKKLAPLADDAVVPGGVARREAAKQGTPGRVHLDAEQHRGGRRFDLRLPRQADARVQAPAPERPPCDHPVQPDHRRCRRTSRRAPLSSRGKAAPGYYIAKLIIKLINAVARRRQQRPARRRGL